MTEGNDKRPTASDADWLATRHYLREHRRELTLDAAELYPRPPRVGASVLLSRPEWISAGPLPLGEVSLAWSTAPFDPVLSSPAAAETPPNGDLRTYVEAVEKLDRPRLLQNRPTYRITGAAIDGPCPTLSFGAGMYFDVLNVGEAIAHEFAHWYRHRPSRTAELGDLPLRQRIGDPTDPARRPMLVAITTLTIRYDRKRGEARFLVHWRDPAKVATNGGYYQVVPVGMFQPAGEASTDATGDFDLWRCMVREYSEELLGAAEHENVDYEHWPFFRALQAARADGDCRPYLLGLGVDPLTLATDLLTVVIFDSAAFDALFAGLVEINLEGRTKVRGDDGLVGTPFTADTVRRLVDQERMQPAGAATLDIAWRHRETLLG